MSVEMTTPKQQRSDLDVEAFRKRLLDDKQMAEETIAATRQQEGSEPGSEPDGMGTTGTANRSELSDYDNHPADAATELFMREEDMALIQNAREMVSKIDRALAKIAEGTYGLSDRSGAPIPQERLQAIPYATLTTDEQEIEDAG